MKDQDKSIFTILFKDACEKCFDSRLISPLSETDSKQLSSEILKHTGLVLGAKSIKNYSSFILNIKKPGSENPSDATLDTLARYVLNAPHTNEILRKDRESHYPYWFQYRSRHSSPVPEGKEVHVNFKKAITILLIALPVAILIFIIINRTHKSRPEYFRDNFNSINEDSLTGRGWIVKSKDLYWWTRRNERKGCLTLFTLKGDNWKNDENPAGIKNRLTRRISTDCFMAEVHLTNFIPMHNWQQAGLLLSEDSSCIGKALRLSISYNDFFGGYVKPAEIIIQVLSSAGSGSVSRPEEIAHVALFSIEPDKIQLVQNNLSSSSLKIEKKGDQYRFLYTTGPGENFAFKEAVSGKFDMHPRFISLFAIQGWAEQNFTMPACIDSFAFASISCDK